MCAPVLGAVVFRVPKPGQTRRSAPTHAPESSVPGRGAPMCAPVLGAVVFRVPKPGQTHRSAPTRWAMAGADTQVCPYLRVIRLLCIQFLI